MPAYPDSAHDPETLLQRRLDRAVSDANVLGGVFTLLGTAVCLIAVGTGGARTARAMAATAGIVLLGPGIVYLVEARYLHRREPWAATLGIRTALAHVGLIVVVLIAVTCGLLGRWTAAILPVGMGVFFTPALIAFVLHTLQARAAARLLYEPGAAFQPIFASAAPSPPLPPPPPTATETARDRSPPPPLT